MRLKRLAFFLLVAIALPITLLAFSALLGAGVVRRGGALWVTAAALGITYLPGLAPAVFSKPAFKPLIAAASTCVWALFALLAFPLFFPGERTDALRTGLLITGLPNGLIDLGLSIEKDFPKLGHARTPPPAARPLETRADTGGKIGRLELPTQAIGNAITVVITVDGEGGHSASLRMLLDTGATLTTLSHRALEELNVKAKPEAPKARLGTASGELEAPIVIVDRLWLGRLDVPAVTIAVCDLCEDRNVAGLLGLNVLGQFLVTLDAAHSKIALEPRDSGTDRVLDIAPWTTIRATATGWLDGRVEVDVSVTNAADRAIAAAEVAIQCNATYIAELRDIPAHGTGSTVVTLPRGADCDRYAAPLDRARW